VRCYLFELQSSRFTRPKPSKTHVTARMVGPWHFEATEYAKATTDDWQRHLPHLQTVTGSDHEDQDSCPRCDAGGAPAPVTSDLRPSIAWIFGPTLSYAQLINSAHLNVAMRYVARQFNLHQYQQHQQLGCL
jgi:hypothetical protein